jgi:hypothetical protein
VSGGKNKVSGNSKQCKCSAIGTRLAKYSKNKVSGKEQEIQSKELETKEV